MEKLLAALQSAPSAAHVAATRAGKQVDTAWRQYVVALSKLPGEPLAANATRLLEMLDPATESVAYLTVLSAALPPSDTRGAIDRTVLLDKTVGFLLVFAPYQIRYVGTLLVNLLHMIAKGGIFPPRVAAELLASTIRRIDPSASVFTSTHLLLVQTAIENSCVEAALPVIDRPILYFPDMDGPKEAPWLFDEDLDPTLFISSSTGLTHAVKSSSVLEYNLLCGMIYVSRRDWVKAQQALGRAVTHPLKDKNPSAIMVDSYKKWLLVGLLSEGQAPALPNYTPLAAKSVYSALAEPYEDVARLFSTTNATELKAVVEASRERWSEDGNVGLIGEVVEAYQKWQVLQLRKIYQPVSMAQICSMTVSAQSGKPVEDPEEATALVRGMIASGMLQGELQLGTTADESFLTFHEEEAVLSEHDFAKEVARLHRNIDILGKHYRQTNERLSNGKEYVRHVVREQKLQGSNDSESRTMEFEDEDLMTGVVSHS